ncbi:hypothetical protein EDB85DRAFT_1914214, partial [Lactarius pseudohatsudake]
MLIASQSAEAGCSPHDLSCSFPSSVTGSSAGLFHGAINTSHRFARHFFFLPCLLFCFCRPAVLLYIFGLSSHVPAAALDPCLVLCTLLCGVIFANVQHRMGNQRKKTTEWRRSWRRFGAGGYFLQTLGDISARNKNALPARLVHAFITPMALWNIVDPRSINSATTSATTLIHRNHSTTAVALD